MEAQFSLKSVRVAGALGVLGSLIGFAEFPLWYVGPIPQFADATAFCAFVTQHSKLYLTRSLMDFFIFSLLLVFFGGFRHLIVMTQAAYEWLATTFFGIALVYIAVTLVSGALTGAAGLDTLDGRGDPSVVRAFIEGSVLLFCTVAGVLVATMMVVAAILIQRTRALPQWTSWLAWLVAICNLAFVPALYRGTNFENFYSASGDGPGAAAPMAFIIWVLATAICMLRMRATVEPDGAGVVAPPLPVRSAASARF